MEPHRERRLVPDLVRHALPGHDPSKVPDPQWVREWTDAWRPNDPRLTRLPTAEIAHPLGEILGERSDDRALSMFPSFRRAAMTAS